MLNKPSRALHGVTKSLKVLLNWPLLKIKQTVLYLKYEYWNSSAKEKHRNKSRKLHSQNYKCKLSERM